MSASTLSSLYNHRRNARSSTRFHSYRLPLIPALDISVVVEIAITPPDDCAGYQEDWEPFSYTLRRGDQAIDPRGAEWLLQQVREQIDGCVLPGFDEWLRDKFWWMR